MYRSNPCLQSLDSGCLEPLRPFYHLLTFTGGLIIVKTLKNNHSGHFLTHIQAANSRQNHYPRYRSRTGIPDDPECFGNTTGIRYKNRETRPMPFEMFLFLFFQIPQCFFSHTNENRDSAGKDLTCTSAVVLIRIW